MTNRTVLVAALALAAMITMTWPTSVQGQRAEPQVDIVRTVGCVEMRNGDAATWWLTRVADPTEIRAGVFNVNQVEEAKEEALGTREFQLIGVAEFLDAESLLRFGDRAQFTTADQVNATNQLREGHTVLVKGLLIEASTTAGTTAGAPARINLLAVVGLADTCG